MDANLASTSLTSRMRTGLGSYMARLAKVLEAISLSSIGKPSSILPGIVADVPAVIAM